MQDASLRLASAQRAVKLAQDKQRPNASLELTQDDQNNGQFGLSLSFDPFNKQLKRDLTKAQVNWMRQQQDFEDQKDQVKISILQSLNQLEASMVQIEQLEHSLEQSQTLIDSLTLGFNLGRNSANTLVDAQDKHLSLAYAALDAKINFLNQLDELHGHLLGDYLEFHQMKDVMGQLNNSPKLFSEYE